MGGLGTAARAFMSPGKRHDHRDKPGGERILQERLGTTQRAQQFYDSQVTSHLTPVMRQFIQRMEMAFIATSDSAGECDCSLRAGPAGFIRILDERIIAYPEYRGNGVMASLGNIVENPHIGVFLADFTHDLIGLHVNGRASLVSPARMPEFDLLLLESEPPRAPAGTMGHGARHRGLHSLLQAHSQDGPSVSGAALGNR